MDARRDLYSALMSKGPHSPDRSERSTGLIDAFAAEERAAELRAAADELLAEWAPLAPFRITQAAEFLRDRADEIERGEST